MHFATRKKMIGQLDDHIDSIPKTNKEEIKWWNIFKEWVREYDTNTQFSIEFKDKAESSMCGVYKLMIGDKYILGHIQKLHQARKSYWNSIGKIMADPTEALQDPQHYFHKIALHLQTYPSDATVVAVIRMLEECEPDKLTSVRAQWNEKCKKDSKCLNNNLK